MRTITDFIKTSILGGILVIMPLYLSLLLLLKALVGMQALINPITKLLPLSFQHPQIIAVVFMTSLCFICGVAVRTSLGRCAIKAIERNLLEKIPGYTLIRGLAGTLVGKENEQTFTVVLAEIEDALVPAFFVEDCGDDQCAIFVPSIPTPAAGAIYIIAKHRVHLVDVHFSKAVSVISKWGAGSKELFEGMKRAELKTEKVI
jgi:uncharacterized membrane protein